MREIISGAYDKAMKILIENREDMDRVVAYLLAKETITGGEMTAILEGTDPALAENYGASPEPPARREPQSPIALAGDKSAEPTQTDIPPEGKPKDGGELPH